LHPLTHVLDERDGPTNHRFRLLLTETQPLQQFLPHLATNLAAKACF
jgi:hypothetical protein